MVNKTKLNLIIILIMLVLIPSSLALQQTSGDLSLDESVPSARSASYEIKNDKNISVDVVLSSDVDNYIDYPKQLSLNPQEIKSVDISIKHVPTKTISGVIYASEKSNISTGASLNVNLGKRISIAGTYGTQSNTDNIDKIIAVILVVSILGVTFIIFRMMIRR